MAKASLLKNISFVDNQNEDREIGCFKACYGLAQDKKHHITNQDPDEDEDLDDEDYDEDDFEDDEDFDDDEDDFDEDDDEFDEDEESEGLEEEE